MELTQIAFLGVLLLVGVGLYGLLVLRNLIQIIIALQILAKGAALALVWAGNVAGQPQLGQSLALTVIVTDTMVAVVALALALQIHRRFGTLDIRALPGGES